MLRQARKNGITLDELFSTSYPSNKQTPAQKIISMYSERRGGSKYKPKRSRAPNRSKPRKRSKCAKFSKSMCNNNSKKTRGCVWRKNTGCVRKSRRSGRRSGRKSRKPVRNSQKTSGCGCLGVRCLSNYHAQKVGNMINRIHLQYHGGVPNHVVADLVADPVVKAVNHVVADLVADQVLKNDNPRILA